MHSAVFQSARCSQGLVMRYGPIPCVLHVVVALGAVLCLPVSAAMPSDPVSLGTLFFSPAERLEVEQSRSGDNPQAISAGKAISLKGLVRRGRGKGTSWINGQTVPEGQAVPSAGVPVISAKQVTIDGKSLRVGETLDVESGARHDIVPPDSTVKRQK